LKEGSREPETSYRQVPIDFQFQSRGQEPAKARGVDWRAELRRKLSQRSAAQASEKGERETGTQLPSKGQSQGTAAAPRQSEAVAPAGERAARPFHPLAEPGRPLRSTPQNPTTPKELIPGSEAASVKSGPMQTEPAGAPGIFHPLAEPESPPRKASVARPEKKDAHFILEKPLVRTPARSRTPSSAPLSGAPPEQRRLLLDLEAAVEPEEPRVLDAPPEEAVSAVSAEVLFSRVLAGIIDLLLPVLQSFVFTIIASWVLGFELFSSSALDWIAYLFCGFYLLNSLFFLLLAGMTPGMYLTELRLRGADSEEYSAVAVVVRVLLYLPVLVTVVGLLTALVDGRRRCLHDLVTGTQIVPHSEEDEGPVAPF
jgi:uncharacterized RDD family membrane protein YckC